METLVLREVQIQASRFGEGKYNAQLQDSWQTSCRSWHLSWDVKGGQDLEIEVGVRLGRKPFQMDRPA